jgi:OmcA/MtrC family decaheme c-type cytochrome
MKNRFLRYGGAALLALFIAGCGGDDGKDGAPGKDADPAITDQLQEDVGQLQTDVAALQGQALNPESCAVCHGGTQPLAASGSMHQAAYDELYQDGEMVISDMAFTAAGTTAELKFKMTLKLAKFDCSTTRKDFRIGAYWAEYDTVTKTFPSSQNLANTSNGITFTKAWDEPSNTCTFTVAGLSTATVAKMAGNGIVNIYGTDQIQAVTSGISGVYQGKYPFGALLTVGTVDYVSLANVSGCENCHTQPYLKHGERYGQVPVAGGGKGLDFVLCKTCHVDTTDGTHRDWQLLKDDPAKYVELQEAAAACDAKDDTSCDSLNEQVGLVFGTKYDYKRNVKNDVHMAHSMEFAYPQSIRNCVTCHEGNLDKVLADDKYKAETCISCHSLDAEPYGLKTMMANAPVYNHGQFLGSTEALKAGNCGGCHSKAAAVAPTFMALHNGGYEPMIFAADGTRYSDTFKGSIDKASLAADNLLTIEFSSTGSYGGLSAADIKPTILIGLYGYNTKDFYVAAHGRDFDDNGDGVIGGTGDGRNLEYVVGAAGNKAPRFETKIAANGQWVVTADLSAWADDIAAGKIKRAEIAVLQDLRSTFAVGSKPAEEIILAVNAPSKTFNFAANDFEDYFDDIVQVAAGKRADGTTTGCNTCHVQVPSVPAFHSGIRGGNIKVCRICHEVSSPGSHLEMQSRSIDSYLHAIHSFQPFDPGDINFDDPVAKLEYEHHVESQFPRFGTDCESCHKPGTYDVPDQSKSMASVMSGIDTCKTTDPAVPNCAAANRNIAPGSYGQWITGPAVRACGACHRAETLTADDGAGDPGALATLMGHWNTNGYIVNVPDGTSSADRTTLWRKIVDLMTK